MVVLGDSDCGKSALCFKFARHMFNSKYQPTAGVDFYSRRISLPPQTSVLIQLWDVDGQSINSTSMLRTYVFGANALLFVYDVTNKQSFENVRDWIRAVKAVAVESNDKSPGMFLVGTKTDLEHRRTVTIERSVEVAAEFQLNCFHVSSKTGDNVELVFKKISAQLAGVELSQAEKECDIGIVQAPLSSSSATSQLYRPLYSKLDDSLPMTAIDDINDRKAALPKQNTVDVPKAPTGAILTAPSRPSIIRGSVACSIN